ncbi:MAG: DUF3276 family protein [Alistipes sp.]|jgi:hypothetical protein|nr:DUF3276 family protein [Alistipes sp.]
MAYDNHRRYEHEDSEEQIYSKVVRAGKRTYFFDVKATRGDDYFITITESRKLQNNDGSESYTRSKMHLYKEDFAKFSDGLNEIVDYIKQHKPDYFEHKE